MISFVLAAASAVLLIFLAFLGTVQNRGKRKLVVIAAVFLILAVSACMALLSVEAQPQDSEQIRIEATHRKNDAAKDNAIYLTGVRVGENMLSFETDENERWLLSGNWYTWREDGDDDRERTYTDSFLLTIPVGRDRWLEFFTNKSKGIVRIEALGEEWEVDCYSEEDGRVRVNIPNTSEEHLSTIKRKSLQTLFITFSCCMSLLFAAWIAFRFLYRKTGPFRERYLYFWEDWRGWKGVLFYLLHYSALFLVLRFLVFLPFLQQGKTFLWETDAIPQYLPSWIERTQRMREVLSALLHGKLLSIQGYDFRDGPIKQIVGFSPVYLLGILWGEERMEQFYSFLILLRLYLAGAAFSLLGAFYKKKPSAVLVGAVAYAYCGFSLYFGIRHPGFTGPMYLFPILLIGTEKIIKRENPFLFIAFVFISVVYSPYYAGMMAVLVTLFGFIRYFTTREKGNGDGFLGFLFRFALAGLTGCALAGVTLIPYLINVFDTGRIGSEVVSANSGGWFVNALKAYAVFPLSYYKRFLSYFLVIPGHTYYSLCLGFSTLCFPAIILLYFGKDKRMRSIRVLFATLTLLALSPLAAYIMSGFSTYSHRWSYAYALGVSFVLASIIPKLVRANKKEYLTVFISACVYFCVCFLFVREYRENTLISSTALLASLLTLWCASRFGSRCATVGALFIVCISSCLSAFLLYSPNQRNYTSEFADKGAASQYYEESIYSVFSNSESMKDGSFFRVSGSGITAQSLNAADLYGVNGLTYHDSYSFNSYTDWVNGMETVTMDEYHHHYGPGNRLGVLSLAGVKYYVWDPKDFEVMPYGFEETEKVEGTEKLILENKYWLPIGFTTTTYLTEAEYENLSPIERQEAQLQAVALDLSPEEQSQLERLAFNSRAKKLEYQIADRKGVSWTDGVLQVDRAEATMKLLFDEMPGCELYLRVVELDLTEVSSSENWLLSVRSDNGSASAHFYSDGFLYSPRLHSQILNLGYSETGLTSCVITFPKKGIYQLEGLELWCIPTDRYAEEINAFRQDVLEEIETDDTSLKGRISASRDELLCLSIPYDEAWSAYVDGYPSALYRADKAWIALKLSPGEHTVELRYRIRGFYEGLVLSSLGGVALVTILAASFRKRRKRRERNQADKN